MAMKRTTSNRLSQVLKSRLGLSKNKAPQTYYTTEQLDYFVPISTCSGFVKLVSEAQSAFQEHHQQGRNTDNNISALPSQLFAQEALLLTLGERYAFAHWNVSPDLIQKALAKIGGKAKLVLRFYDQQSSWDVEIFDPEGNWYLKLNQPNQAVRFAVGLKNQQHFHAICEAKPLELEDNGQKLNSFGEITKALKAHNQGTLDGFSFRYDGLLKKSLGPYFYELLKSGRIQSIPDSSYDALFQDIGLLHKKRGSAKHHAP